MRVTPVLDLLGGRAVHARGGDRAAYRVVEGVLGHGSDPLALAAAYRTRLGSDSLYLADLDSIAGRAGTVHALLPLLARLGIEVWCDAVVRTPGGARALLERGAARVVVGLEALRSLDELAAVLAEVGPERLIFSLDHRAGRPVAGGAELARRDPLSLAHAAAGLGVRRLICLALDRVGSGAGPALDLVEALRAELPELECLAGGGVRGADDLRALAERGCAGALVATAFHAGALSRVDLERLAGRASGAPPGTTPPARTTPRR